jgi:hypothetical protein
VREEPQTLTVRGYVRPPSICSSETMHALPDPADPDQAVIDNVPFFVDGVNFGDIVCLGPPDDIGIRPIEGVVVPSGCIRFLVILGPLCGDDLIEHLYDLFSLPMVRIEGGHNLLAVSVHPDVDPEEVAFEVVLWFEEKGIDPVNETVGITEFFESEVGPLP